MKINESKLIKNLSEDYFLTEFQEDPKKAVEKAVESSKENPLSYDVWIYRIIIFALGFTLVFMSCSLCFKMGSEKIEVPDVFISVISGTLGAIAGLLAPSPVK
jgi:cytochrome c biogenesis protein CcdA